MADPGSVNSPALREPGTGNTPRPGAAAGCQDRIGDAQEPSWGPRWGQQGRGVKQRRRIGQQGGNEDEQGGAKTKPCDQGQAEASHGQPAGRDRPAPHEGMSGQQHHQAHRPEAERRPDAEQARPAGLPAAAAQRRAAGSLNSVHLPWVRSALPDGCHFATGQSSILSPFAPQKDLQFS